MRAILVGSAFAVAVLVVGSCGGKGTPTPPTPNVTSVTISSSTDLLKVKETFTFAATAAQSDGTSAAVGEWRSDTPAVASVDGATGRVTGVGSGTATIIATHKGISATKTVRVVPDFGGTWKGEFKMTSCSMSGDWSTAGAGWDPCDTYTSVGPVEFEFGQTRDQVAGIVEYSVLLDQLGRGVLHRAIGSVAGTIDASGHLKLSGVFTNPSDQARYTLTGAGNDLHIPAERMLGSFKVDLTKASLTGRTTTGFAIDGDGLTRIR